MMIPRICTYMNIKVDSLLGSLRLPIRCPGSELEIFPMGRSMFVLGTWRYSPIPHVASDHSAYGIHETISESSLSSNIIPSLYQTSWLISRISSCFWTTNSSPILFFGKYMEIWRIPYSLHFIAPPSQSQHRDKPQVNPYQTGWDFIPKWDLNSQRPFLHFLFWSNCMTDPIVIPLSHFGVNYPRPTTKICWKWSVFVGIHRIFRAPPSLKFGGAWGTGLKSYLRRGIWGDLCVLGTEVKTHRVWRCLNMFLNIQVWGGLFELIRTLIRRMLNFDIHWIFTCTEITFTSHHCNLTKCCTRTNTGCKLVDTPNRHQMVIMNNWMNFSKIKPSSESTFELKGSSLYLPGS